MNLSYIYFFHELNYFKSGPPKTVQITLQMGPTCSTTKTAQEKKRYSRVSSSSMAITSHLFSTSLLPSASSLQKPLSSTSFTSTTSFSCPSNPSLLFIRSSRARYVQSSPALGGDPLGDFGARDPFPAEIESGFGEKVLGNVGTEHRILIPSLSALSLAQQSCTPVPASQPPMTDEDAQRLLKKARIEYPFSVFGSISVKRGLILDTHLQYVVLRTIWKGKLDKPCRVWCWDWFEEAELQYPISVFSSKSI